MKKSLVIVLFFVMCLSAYAGDRVYTDGDLGAYESKKDLNSYREDKIIEIDKKISDLQRIADLMHKASEISSDDDMDKYQKCRQLRAIYDEAEIYGWDSRSSKRLLKKLCGRYY